MNNRAMTMAILIALLSVFLVSSWVSDVEERAQKRYGTTVLVVKAKLDIKESQTITEDMLALEAIPKTFREPAAIFFEKATQDDETVKSLRSIVGSVAIVPIKKGEQVAYNKITEPGIRTGLSPQVAPGRRAIAMNVTNQSSVSKLIKPGDRVDVIAVLDMGGGKENKVSKTILQDVVVLSVGQNVTNNIPRKLEMEGQKMAYRSLNEDTSFDTVTLEVEPDQAQMVALVNGNGDSAITLVLRNNDDTERKNFGSTMMSDILGADAGRVQRNTAGQRR
ncbi:MAG: Flp pilus assembly protein CpaB [Cryobacterium sp.]|nr:Flp pilus assembly protein CpaB [Oligoflexia bacterium]